MVHDICISYASAGIRRSILIGAVALVLAGVALAAAWKFIAPPRDTPPAPVAMPAPAAAPGESRLAFGSVDTASAPNSWSPPIPFSTSPHQDLGHRQGPAAVADRIDEQSRSLRGESRRAHRKPKPSDPNEHGQRSGLLHASFFQTAQEHDFHGAEGLSRVPSP
jgi:hypothetical protein